MKPRFLAVAVVAVLALAGCGQSSSDATASTGNKAVPLVAADRTLGKPDAPVQIVEYAAPSCPHCAHFNETVFPLLKSAYIDTGKVFYVFRVFPIGPQDIPAEALARCVPKENYFAFIDLLFKKQDVWDPEYGITNVQAGLLEVANSVGLDQATALRCMQDKSQADRITKSEQEAVEKYNVNSTPTFIVNGTVRVGIVDQDSLRKLLDPLVSKK